MSILSSNFCENELHAIWKKLKSLPKNSGGKRVKSFDFLSLR